MSAISFPNLWIPRRKIWTPARAAGAIIDKAKRFRDGLLDLMAVCVGPGGATVTNDGAVESDGSCLPCGSGSGSGPATNCGCSDGRLISNLQVTFGSGIVACAGCILVPSISFTGRSVSGSLSGSTFCLHNISTDANRCYWQYHGPLPVTVNFWDFSTACSGSPTHSVSTGYVAAHYDIGISNFFFVSAYVIHPTRPTVGVDLFEGQSPSTGLFDCDSPIEVDWVESPFLTHTLTTPCGDYQGGTDYIIGAHGGSALININGC